MVLNEWAVPCNIPKPAYIGSTTPARGHIASQVRMRSRCPSPEPLLLSTSNFKATRAVVARAAEVGDPERTVPRSSWRRELGNDAATGVEVLDYRRPAGSCKVASLGTHVPSSLDTVSSRSTRHRPRSLRLATTRPVRVAVCPG